MLVQIHSDIGWLGESARTADSRETDRKEDGRKARTVRGKQEGCSSEAMMQAFTSRILSWVLHPHLSDQKVCSP